jgi:predicted Zn-dependent protease with MMP-like domain
MTRAERLRFDAIFERVLETVPPRVRALLEEAPVVIEDRPTPHMLRQLGLDPGDDLLCGLHTGTPLTERSVNHAHDVPEMIHLFREGIVEEAGGWEPWVDEAGVDWGGEERIAAEIRITLLHEIGHHFGLEEGDLEQLGYG